MEGQNQPRTKYLPQHLPSHHPTKSESIKTWNNQFHSLKLKSYIRSRSRRQSCLRNKHILLNSSKYKKSTRRLKSYKKETTIRNPTKQRTTTRFQNTNREKSEANLIKGGVAGTIGDRRRGRRSRVGQPPRSTAISVDGAVGGRGSVQWGLELVGGVEDLVGDP